MRVDVTKNGVEFVRYHKKDVENLRYLTKGENYRSWISRPRSYDENISLPKGILYKPFKYPKILGLKDNPRAGITWLKDFMPPRNAENKELRNCYLVYFKTRKNKWHHVKTFKSKTTRYKDCFLFLFHVDGAKAVKEFYTHENTVVIEQKLLYNITVVPVYFLYIKDGSYREEIRELAMYELFNEIYWSLEDKKERKATVERYNAMALGDLFLCKLVQTSESGEQIFIRIEFASNQEVNLNNYTLDLTRNVVGRDGVRVNSFGELLEGINKQRNSGTEQFISFCNKERSSKEHLWDLAVRIFFKCKEWFVYKDYYQLNEERNINKIKYFFKYRN